MASSRHLGDLTWPEAGTHEHATLLVVPLGATEQHGPHLPLSTDTLIAEALALELAKRRDDVLVAPSIPYGSSGEHKGFSGTLSIGRDALAHVLIELVRSADRFAGVVLVSAHGGNAEPLRRAVDLLCSEGRVVLSWWPRVRTARSDAHAGWLETSMLLALTPRSVRLDSAEGGETRPLSEIRDALEKHGVAAVSPNGVLGDPRGASAEAGREIFESLVQDLCSAVAVRFGATNAGERLPGGAELR
ncbi:MAG TPA: mycofactocin biosynthesis peptidyl-dipeptidase MftE [Acidimicrobiales bacterium]|nr:mycofactocin biosynthesis peptidyl-dipeptidase MftE [Acidimicrobiales bacterium]